MPPFRVGFSKQRKKPGWRRSSNCVQNAFFRLSPSGRNEKTPLGSNFTISVSYHNFGWALPSSTKSRVDEDRPIAFKSRLFDFPHRVETKKHPFHQIWQFRFHATILVGLYQAAQKAGLTKIVQLRSKRVSSTFPIGAKRKNTLGIEFYNFGFIQQFWVGFSSSAKSRVDKDRPIAFKTPLFEFPHRGETKKHPWDGILKFTFHATILGGLFQAAQKAGLTKIVQLRSKRVFSTFPIGAKRKNTLGIEFYNFGFIPQFWVGLTKQHKKPGWRRSSNCVQIAFVRLSPSGRNEKAPFPSNLTISFSCHHFGWAFPSSAKSWVVEDRPIAFKTPLFDFPIWPKRKNTLAIEFCNFGFMPPFWLGFSKQRKKPGWRRSSNCVQNAFFRLFPPGRNEKTPLGSNFTILRFMPPFSVGFSKHRKKPGWRRSSNCVQNAFFRLSLLRRNERTPLGWNFKICISCHHFGWAFPSSAKSRVDEDRPIAFKRRFFDFPHRDETKKHPCDRILQFRFHATILGGLFQAAQKPGLTKIVQLRSKRLCSNFPIGAKRKNTLRMEFYNFGFMPPFWVGFTKQRKKLGWRRSSNCVKKAFFRLSPSGRNQKTPLRSNFTISVSRHHFGWALQSSEKSRIDEDRPIAFKTRFFDFPIGAKTKKNPCDRILKFRFHATILGGLFKAAQKAGLSKIVQLHSKRLCSTSPYGPNEKKLLGSNFAISVSCHHFRGTFPSSAKRRVDRRFSNCVKNSFFRLSPSGRNEKTPLGSNFTTSVSCHHFGWAFSSSAKSRVDEDRPIAFKTPLFDFPHRGETKKHPWDWIFQFRFHATILGGLF